MKTYVTLIMLSAAATLIAGDLPSKTDKSLLNEVADAQERGLNFLIKQQLPNGSWNMHPAITGLAATSIYRYGKPLTKEQQAAADNGIKFILSCVKTNGAIFGDDEHDKYPNYSTAICALALQASGKAEYTDIIKKARAFLIGTQFDEGEKIDPKNPSFGGIGYGKRERPDLSNTAWALEAIHLTESLESAADGPISKEHWKKAVAFLQRCQNLPKSNDQSWAKVAANDDIGGFIYMPGDPSEDKPAVSFASEGEPNDGKTPLRSYGSMSYAGLKSFLYAELKKDDPRVVACMEWLGKNYTLDENPGMGAQGLFYYYHTLAKALTAYGEDTFIQIPTGKKHDWRNELLTKLVSLQKVDLKTNEGYWQNENNRWWESDKVLATCYGLLTIEIIQAR